MTHYDDDPVMATEAEIIYACARGGLSLPAADDMELWEVAAALGLHRIETWEQRDTREIVEAKGQYWEETQQQRMEKFAGYADRRKARKKARARGKTDDVVGAN